MPPEIYVDGDAPIYQPGVSSRTPLPATLACRDCAAQGFRVFYCCGRVRCDGCHDRHVDEVVHG